MVEELFALTADDVRRLRDLLNWHDRQRGNSLRADHPAKRNPAVKWDDDVRVTSTTATSGRYPGRIRDYDAAAATYSDRSGSQDCWVVFLNGYTPVAGDVSGNVTWRAELKGTREADGIAILQADPFGGGGVTGSGTQNHLTYWNTSSTLSSVPLEWDSTPGYFIFKDGIILEAAAVGITTTTADDTDLIYGTTANTSFWVLDNATGGASPITIAGIGGGTLGLVLYLHTVSDVNITLLHDDATASAGTRIYTPNATDLVLTGGEYQKLAMLIYTGSQNIGESGWRVFPNF